MTHLMLSGTYDMNMESYILRGKSLIKEAKRDLSESNFNELRKRLFLEFSRSIQKFYYVKDPAFPVEYSARLEKLPFIKIMENRPVKPGEFYLSGCKPSVYYAPNGSSVSYEIVVPHREKEGTR